MRRGLPVFHTTVILAALVVAALLGTTLWVVGNLADQVSGARGARDALVAQVESLGVEPVVTPPPGEAGPQGEQGPPPTDEQVQAAVAAYCAVAARCDGDRGPQGVRGTGPSRADVARAVRSYCDSRGDCQGPPGEVGEQGPDGERGPPPSDLQVAEAVAGYCADDRCRGPQGERGPKGEAGAIGPAGEPGQDGVDGTAGTDGADGRGITAVSDPHETDAGNCVLTISYTHQPTAQDVDIPDQFCRGPILEVPQ